MKEAVWQRGGGPLHLRCTLCLLAGAEFAGLVPGSIFVTQLKIQVSMCS